MAKKKFTDPYAKMGDFKPILKRLPELGFFEANCRIMADELHCIRTYADGSNMLYDLVRKIPVALYDNLELETYSIFLNINNEIVKPMDQAWAFKITYITLHELKERVEKKEFRDVFRPGGGSTPD
jgi:hypothetical protein